MINIKDVNKKRVLEVIMAIILLIAIYITVRYSMPKSITTANNANDTNSTIIALDAGHGGIDGGKEGINGTLEKDINLSITYKVKSLLEEKGFKVILTRTEDKGLYSESDANKKAADMKKRCKIIEDSKADIAVSIHQNSFSDCSVCGAQIFYYKHSAEGKKLASIMQKSFADNVNTKNTRVEKANDTYYMLINTKCPIVIAECGFLSNKEEADNLMNEEYQNKVAYAITDGITKYLNQ